MNINILFDTTNPEEVCKAQAIMRLFTADADGVTHVVPDSAPADAKWVQNAPGAMPNLIGPDNATIQVA